ncbi:hypothetical protein LCGC14_2873290, partial [marine sediment metagenome]
IGKKVNDTFAWPTPYQGPPSGPSEIIPSYIFNITGSFNYFPKLLNWQPYNARTEFYGVMSLGTYANLEKLSENVSEGYEWDYGLSNAQLGLYLKPKDSANTTFTNVSTNGWNIFAGYIRNGRTFEQLNDTNRFDTNNISMYSHPYNNGTANVPFITIDGFSTINKGKSEVEVFGKLWSKINDELFEFKGGSYGDGRAWVLQPFTETHGHFELKEITNKKGIKLEEFVKNKKISSFEFSFQIKYRKVGSNNWKKYSPQNFIYVFDKNLFWANV